MSMRKIAPVLRESMHYIPARAGTRKTAERELRALLTVASAVRRHVREESQPLSTGNEHAAWEALCQAIEDLDKVNGGGK